MTGPAQDMSRWARICLVMLPLLAGLHAHDGHAQQASPTPPARDAAAPAKEPPPPASVTVLGARDAHGVLGRDVRSSTGEDMGQIVDVIVDLNGTVRAAVIDFGGFLGVGSRKIVVDWTALDFKHLADKKDQVSLDLTKEQVKAAPEFKEDKPVVVLGAAGKLSPWIFDH